MAITLDGTTGITSPNDTTGNQSYTGTLTGGTGVVNLGSGQFYKDASGNVGIGTASPTQLLSVYSAGAANALISAGNGTTGVNGTWFGVDSTGNGLVNVRGAYPLIFSTTSLERMRIDSSGNLLVGLTASAGLGAKLQAKAASTGTALETFDSAGNQLCAFRDNGFAYIPPAYNKTTASAANMFVGSSGDLYRSTSSLKYKTDVQNATHGLTEVLKLRSVTYKGINDGDTVFGGLIAEEVHEAGLTEFVQYAEDGTPDALAYGQMVALAFKAIQEQQAKLTDMSLTLANATALIESLTTRLTILETK